MTRLITALKVFFTLALLLGIIYPVSITVISQLFMTKEANGSLIEKNGIIIGSSLIGQKFTQPKYFHGRPSAHDYDAANSGGSNWAPSNPTFIQEVSVRIAQIKQENYAEAKRALPADMVLTSGSGLDPHISLANALIQAPRIAAARHLHPQKIQQLITNNTDLDFIGIWGNAGVNVLKLNLALDEIHTTN